MRFKFFPLIGVVLVCAFSAAAQAVIETGSEVRLNEKSADVRLAIESAAALPNTTAHIELLDTSGLVVSTTSGKISVAAGRHDHHFQLPLQNAAAVQEDLTWYRLRYRVGSASGIISMSRLVRDLFELSVSAGESLMSGMRYRVRVRAVNPFTGRPAAGVGVNADVELDLAGETDPLRLKGTGQTDNEGFAVIDVPIPVAVRLDGDGEIKVTGRRNGIVREAEADLNALEGDVQFLMMTDKTIYQPEQTLSVRGILLKGADSKTVLTDHIAEFRISDEDQTLLYREKVTTSGFGVAAIGWRIPANVRLGEYRIEVREEDGEVIGSRRVRITRYDLPNFIVQAKSQKAYYLPGEKEAEIEVRADYLFGKPVTKGKVRVVEETSREWNWKVQKYDIEEGQIREGDTDAGGKFVTRVDLREAHEDIGDSRWTKYKDISFAAYFTDSTTNKTEQRRFDVRVTREPIHVYLIAHTYNLNPELPFNAFVSTFYADGTPAECKVEIKASIDDDEKFKTVARLKTNALGAGRMELDRPKIGAASDDLDLKILADDGKGRRGTFREDLSYNTGDGIHLKAERAIYKPGEAVEIDIRSTEKVGFVYVDIVKGWSVVDSSFAAIKDGRAKLTIPYREDFQGELTISAYTDTNDGETMYANSGIIFPARQGVAVDAAFDKAVYKPNEEATVRFGVVDALGRAIESVLGIAVVDQAVEERARTDADFGTRWSDISGWLGYGRGFGGINVKDLNELDLSKPISDDMQLVGDVILHNSYYYPNVFRTERFFVRARSAFANAIEKQFAPFNAALDNAYRTRNYLHPADDASLKEILGREGLDLDKLRDPWDVRYRPEFSTINERNIVSVRSAGPDKEFGTGDDFVAFSAGFQYFTAVGKDIDAAVNRYHGRTGEFIRDEKRLLAEMGSQELTDRFGRPYRFVFDGEGRYLRLRVKSSGPNGNFEKQEWAGDDFYVWTNRMDYFAPVETKIRVIQSSLKRVPRNETEFRSSLKAAGLDLEAIRDGNGNALYVTAEQKSRYWDRVAIEAVQDFNSTQRAERTVITPVTQLIIQFTIRSSGNDGKRGTYDDVTLTQIVNVLSEQLREDPKPVAVRKKVAFGGSTGAIGGVVTDPQGAVIPGAEVTAINGSTGLTRSVTTTDSGSYLISNLPAGTYSVRASATAFQAAVVEGIPVRAGTVTKTDITLEVGAVSSAVEVTAGDVAMDTTNASVSYSVSGRQVVELPMNSRNALKLMSLSPGTAGKGSEKSTPRLREYFPETLLWQPELVTDASGKAELKFRMADNITSWKMYTIASTKDGKIGVAEKEVTAFQAFFVDLDPPKFLTEGDEIHLPTQVRNYTEMKQQVDVTLDKADWFTLLNGETRRVDVAAGGTENAVFGFKALAPVKDGKQRVTAIAQTDSDAIEKPVTVRPNGREVVKTESRYLSRTEKIAINFPENALPQTRKVELKIYPNLMTHVAESVEGLLQRPYGCGEQTISSTYPNLMILKFAGKSGRTTTAIERKAMKYLQSGYERLLGYQTPEGGFSYWGPRDAADLALTVYAMRFLTDASEFIAVDDAVIKKAESWLLGQQRQDGSWQMKYRWAQNADDKGTKMITTYVARMLAALKRSRKDTAVGAKADAALDRALGYLKLHNAEIDDPYSLALYGLSLSDAGDRTGATAIAERLIPLMRVESGGGYWNLESNTAFNGWGSAGRVETTALVTRLLLELSAPAKSDANAARYKEHADKGMVFLLMSKDRYGVWYSTQTTINVLNTFIAATAVEGNRGEQTLTVVINGSTVEKLIIDRDRLDLINISLDEKFAPGDNTIELRSTGGRSMAQVVSSHYVSWADAEANGRGMNDSRALDFKYECDRNSAAIMQEVTCSVAAERVGFRGYGMLLAEIGTPPGAEVSRESLEKAMESDRSISRYEVLPDRIVVYMWAKAGGATFNFKFRPRYGVNAQTPASVIYDYYNPEAQATVAPLRFSIN